MSGYTVTAWTRFGDEFNILTVVEVTTLREARVVLSDWVAGKRRDHFRVRRIKDGARITVGQRTIGADIQPSEPSFEDPTYRGERL